MAIGSCPIKGRARLHGKLHGGAAVRNGITPPMLAEMYAEVASVYTPPLSDGGSVDSRSGTPSLRIRTPDFTTHEEADHIYRQKRLQRQTEQKLRSIFYGSFVIVAASLGLYEYSRAPVALWGAVLSSFTGAAAGSLQFCRGLRRGWNADGSAAEKKEEDSAV